MGFASRLLLSFALVASLWSGVMAAPLSGTTMNKPVCCHAVSMAGHAGAQEACGCAQDSPCRMQSNPYARVFPALLHGNADQTSLAENPIWSAASDLVEPAREIVAVPCIFLKPPGRLFILHANLLI